MHVTVSDRDDVTVFEGDVAMNEAEKAYLADALASNDPERVREALEGIDEERPDPDVRKVLDALDGAGEGATVEAE